MLLAHSSCLLQQVLVLRGVKFLWMEISHFDHSELKKNDLCSLWGALHQLEILKCSVKTVWFNGSQTSSPFTFFCFLGSLWLKCGIQELRQDGNHHSLKKEFPKSFLQVQNCFCSQRGIKGTASVSVKFHVILCMLTN